MGSSTGQPVAGTGVATDQPRLVRVAVKSLGEDHSVAAWIFAPEGLAPRSVVVCVPGGTFSKLYYHPDVGGAAGYSMAEHLRANGHLVIALDNLGVGDSSRPEDGWALDRKVMADANAQAVAEIANRLRTGILLPGMAPMSDLPMIGIGHSMGGLSLITLQATRPLFDAVAVLGWTNQNGTQTGHGREITGPYTEVTREALRPFFHLPDVPQSVLVADDSHAELIPAGMLADAGRAGVTSADAAKIDVPVFLAFGEVDLCPTPRLEPASYSASNDITLFRLKGSAHNHNFAATRGELFHRLRLWIDNVLSS
jgi:pimeloyl-ACP methyl ester carboxylesterase